MFSWYTQTFIAATVALSSTATAKPYSVPADSLAGAPKASHVVVHTRDLMFDSLDDHTTDGHDVDDEGASYDLQITSLKPIVGAARDAFDTILFTIANAGSDTSRPSKLLVGTKGKSLVTNVSDAHVATRSVIPPIPPGGRVTLRVRVPKVQGDSICYSGSIELPDEP